MRGGLGRSLQAAGAPPAGEHAGQWRVPGSSASRAHSSGQSVTFLSHTCTHMCRQLTSHVCTQTQTHRPLYLNHTFDPSAHALGTQEDTPTGHTSSSKHRPSALVAHTCRKDQALQCERNQVPGKQALSAPLPEPRSRPSIPTSTSTLHTASPLPRALTQVRSQFDCHLPRSKVTVTLL